MEDIGRKLPLHFRHVRDAFRPLDLAKDGKITRSEMRSFLRGFGWSHEIADRLFALADEEGCGTVDYTEFMSHFESVLGPANRPAARSPAIAVKDPNIEREINEIAMIVGEKLVTKFQNSRQAFSPLDLSNTGCITKSEMRRFFRNLNMPNDAADKVYGALLRNGSQTVVYDDFMCLFGPTTLPGGRWRSVDELTNTPRPSIWRIF